MAPVSTYVVTVAATITASAAVGTLGYARSVALRVDDNEERSVENQELLIGDPDVLDHNLVERVSQLEDEIKS